MRAEIYTRIDGLRTEVMGEIERLRSDMHRNFRYLVWMIMGVLLPMLITIIMTILFKK